jgi:predicted metal-dependent enzyme (double-stranded beta helix superfamily)
MQAASDSFAANRRRDRDAAIAAAIGQIKGIEATLGVNRRALVEIEKVLLHLAQCEELFCAEDFPPITMLEEPDRPNVRYLLHSDPDGRFTLYLNSFRPGISTEPHDHRTWAVLVAIEGEETNRIYERSDDGTDPERVVLRIKGEATVKPGHGVKLMPDDIHSIHITGSEATRHLHMYGLALEKLTGRLGFDLKNQTIIPHAPTVANPTKVQ